MACKRKLSPNTSISPADVAPPNTQLKSDTTSEDPLNNPRLYRLTRRLPTRKASTKRDIHVTRRANFIALKKAVLKLLDKDPQPVHLHALGAAITRCCELALSLQTQLVNCVELHAETGTIVLYDDYEALVEGHDDITKTRNVSSITITLRRTAHYI